MVESLCIIIPAHNEGRSIGAVLTGLKEHFESIIVVNDGSLDNTSEESRKNGAIVIDNVVRKGYDGAIEEGFKKASDMKMKYAITTDADGQHNPGDVRKVAEALVKEGEELVVGIRPSFPRFSERLMSLYSRARFGIKDPLCGLKGYDLTFYEILGHFDSYGSIGTELAFFSAIRKCRIRQIQISINRRTFGKPPFGNRVSANMKILRSMLMSIIKL